MFALLQHIYLDDEHDDHPEGRGVLYGVRRASVPPWKATHASYEDQQEGAQEFSDESANAVGAQDLVFPWNVVQEFEFRIFEFHLQKFYYVFGWLCWFFIRKCRFFFDQDVIWWAHKFWYNVHTLKNIYLYSIFEGSTRIILFFTFVTMNFFQKSYFKTAFKGWNFIPIFWYWICFFFFNSKPKFIDLALLFDVNRFSE